MSQDERLSLTPRCNAVTAALNASVPVVEVALNGSLLDANKAFYALCGYTPDEVPSLNIESVFGSEGKDTFLESLETLLRGENYRTDVLTRTRKGDSFWSALTAIPVFDANGTLHRIAAHLVDITEAKMHEVLLSKALTAMVHEVPIPEVLAIVTREVEKIVMDAAIAIVRVDESGELKPLAYPSLPESFADFFSLTSADEQRIRFSLGRAVSSEEPCWVRDLRDDGPSTPLKNLLLSKKFLSCWATPVRSVSGSILGAVGFYFHTVREQDKLPTRVADILGKVCALAIERENAISQIRHIAYYDSVTGLPNRKLLLSGAQQMLETAKFSGIPLAVFHLGIDRFKRVNDSLGPDAGNNLLSAIAARLSEVYREPDSLIGRYSGDEFTIIVLGCSTAQAGSLAKRMQAMINQPHSEAEITFISTASIGISIYPENGSDMDTLLHCADIAMHQAKSGGRAQYCFFSPDQNQKAKERLSLEAHLREAVSRRELSLHYQPKVMLQNNKLYGLEALARWKNPKFGQVPPGQFIPLAEEIGVIGDIGCWLIGEACRQLQHWRAKGINVPSIAVNLSPTNFHDPRLPDIILTNLRAHRLKPDDIIIELTENVLLDETPTTLNTIFKAHAAGITFSMDDFGTGYSSLNYLRQLPIKELKLDRSFVQDIDCDGMSRNLGKAVMHIAESLDLTVVAEGVETEAQHAVLKELGYHVAQGYLYSPPLDAASFASWYTGSPAAD